MGCATSTMSDDTQVFSKQRMMSEAIDRSLMLTLESQRKQTRMFLLGAGESGKSTVLKQMRLLHKNSFTSFERKQYAEVIWLGLFQSMKLLILNARKFHIPLACDRPNLPLQLHKRVVLSAREARADHSLLDDYDIGYSDRRAARAMESALLLESARDMWGDRWGGGSSGGGGSGGDSALDMAALEAAEAGDARAHEPTRDEIARAVAELWHNDPGVRTSLAHSNRFQIELLAAYYFDNVHKFKDPEYRCTDQDILMGRIKTTGITENSFQIRNGVLKVIDAGGQRSERKKWIHCFQDIDVVLFVLAVLEYDQTLYEDGRINRMHESFALFDALCNSQWFYKTPFILFLNKVDLLEEKLLRLPITDYFPEYDRDPLNVSSVLDYMESQLLGLNKTKKPIYVHRTCATDTAGMSFVLSAVTDMVIQQNLKKSGIM